jgi:hypothetical protein
MYSRTAACILGLLLTLSAHQEFGPAAMTAPAACNLNTSAFLSGFQTSPAALGARQWGQSRVKLSVLAVMLPLNAWRLPNRSCVLDHDTEGEFDPHRFDHRGVLPRSWHLVVDAHTHLHIETSGRTVAALVTQ